MLPGPELTQPGGDGLGSRPPRWDQDSCVPMTALCQPPASLAAAELLLQPDLPSSRKHVHGTVLPTLAPPSPAPFVHGRFACLKPWWLLLPLPWLAWWSFFDLLICSSHNKFPPPSQPAHS